MKSKNYNYGYDREVYPNGCDPTWDDNFENNREVDVLLGGPCLSDMFL